MNVQFHDDRDGARSSAWERLESAWETVRSELTDDSASSPLTGDVSPRDDAAAAAAEVDAPMAVVRTVPLALRPRNWVTEVLGPAISSESRTGGALVTRARAPCGTPCRGVEGLELRQQRSDSRCEAGEQWEAWVPGGSQKTNAFLGEHVVTARRQMADKGSRQISVCRDRSFGWRYRSHFTGSLCDRFTPTRRYARRHFADDRFRHGYFCAAGQTCGRDAARKRFDKSCARLFRRSV